MDHVLRKLFWLGAFVSVAATGLLTGCTRNEPVHAVITIDPSKLYQTISAWEATAQAGQDFASYPTYRDELITSAVNDLGINRLRVEARSGFETTAANASSRSRDKRYEIVNDNGDPFQIDTAGFSFTDLDKTIEQVVLPMRELLNARGQRLFVNLNYVDFGPSDFEHKDNPEEYAEFILAIYLHMKEKYGFVPDTVETILEPDTDTADWAPTQVANATAAAASRLKANGFEPAFIAPSTKDAGAALDYIDEIANVAGALEPIVEFSYHRYSGVSENVLRGIAERSSRHGKQTSMLERIGADQKALHQDLKLANVSSWQQYTLAFSGKDEGDSYFKVDSEDNDAKIAMGRRTKYLTQYFRHVRPGAIRIGASTTNSGIDSIAFKNPDGSLIIVLNATSPGTAELAGLPGRSYSASYTNERESGMLFRNSEVADGRGLVVDIPSTGVVTIYTDGAATGN
jgi:hypothetical protein